MLIYIYIYIFGCCGIVIFKYRISALVKKIPGDTDQYLSLPVDIYSAPMWRTGLLAVHTSKYSGVEGEIRRYLMGYMPNTHLSSITLHTHTHSRFWITSSAKCKVNIVINSPFPIFPRDSPTNSMRSSWHATDALLYLFDTFMTVPKAATPCLWAAKISFFSIIRIDSLSPTRLQGSVS